MQCELDLLEICIAGKLAKLVDPTSLHRICLLKKVLARAAAMAFEKDYGGADEFYLIKILSSINSILETKIVGEPVEDLRPCVVISNHVGANKLVKIVPDLIAENLTVEFQGGVTALVNDDSFFLLFAPVFYAISGAGKFSNLSFIPVLMDYPEPHRSFSERMGFVCLKRSGGNNYNFLIRDLRARFDAAKNASKVPVVIMFPEGGTSGKRNGKDPYDLCEFKSGFVKIADIFGLDIRPVVVKFNRDLSFSATMLPPVARENVTRTSVEQIRREMQCALQKEQAGLA